MNTTTRTLTALAALAISATVTAGPASAMYSTTTDPNPVATDGKACVRFWDAAYDRKHGYCLTGTGYYESTTRGPLPPCRYEDSSDCTWNARESGNGFGHSFDALRVDGKVCIHYWDASYDRRNGYCTEDAYPEGDDRS